MELSGKIFTTTGRLFMISCAVVIIAMFLIPSGHSVKAADTFVKGINLNGDAATIDGNAWLSYSAAKSDGFSTTAKRTSSKSITWSPAADSNTNAMLKSVIWQKGAGFTMTQTIANGNYNVYLYLTENYRDNYRSADIKLEGVQIASSVGSMTKNTWVKYGPYNVTVNDGALDMEFVRIKGDPQCAGVAIFKADAAELSGEFRQWHQVILTVDGPSTSETADSNPFYNYRMDVTFRHGGKEIRVPGYFAADGDAANTSATSGNKWRAHLVPDAVGEWTYTVSFRQGTNVAISDDPLAGQPVAPDGLTGSFTIASSDKSGRDNRYRGTLAYVGEHYARFKGTGEYFIFSGSQSPENFLGYGEFDNTVDHGGGGDDMKDGVHWYEPHIKDWRPGDPTWKDGKGKGIIGALNYLASKGMNIYYSLTMNVDGDCRETYPFIDYREYERYDVSKLAQWEIVLSHGDTLGMMLMVITQEEENEQLLGKISDPVRRLYYRELIARFSHHHALQWDLDEEADKHTYYSTADLKDMCNYIRALDPYDHPIQYVQYKSELLDGYKMPDYRQMLGFPNFDAAALQMDPGNVGKYTKRWLDESAAAGHKWLVGAVEVNLSNDGVKPDADDYWHDQIRKYCMWAHLMAGGCGNIYYYGENYPNSDNDCEDFRPRDHLFDLMNYARQFFVKYLPFWAGMHHADDLVAGPRDYVYAKPGDIYAIYLLKGGAPTLDLSNVSGNFTVRWYDPRYGGELQEGSVKMVTGGAQRSLGNPPNEPTKDWAVLVQREGLAW